MTTTHGGAAKKKRGSAKKKGHRKTKSKATKTTKSRKPRKAHRSKKTGGRESVSLESLRKQARRLGVALSKDGKKRTKSQLARAVAYRA